MFTPGKRFGLLAALLLALTLPASSHAQTSYDAQSPAWWQQLEQQIITSLGSPAERIREQALQHVVFFATQYGDKVDFYEAVPRLLRIYDGGESEARRVMAVAALHAVGTEAAMAGLQVRLRSERSERVRHLARLALADYYRTNDVS